MIFFPSQYPLFAQERRLSTLDIRSEQLALFPRIPLPSMQGSDMRPGKPSAVASQKRTSGHVIAVLKVIVKDNDNDVANEEHTALPEELSVQGNYPNPFRTKTEILFHLPESAQIYVEVFDVLGRVIHTSQTQRVDAGWDRTLSLDLSQMSPGLYIYRINVETVSGTLMGTGRFVQVQ